jgi:hypothetical protein
MAPLRSLGLLLWCGLLGAGPLSQAQAAAPTEQQLKAVFVFNFSHFVSWPPGTFAAPDQPFWICLMGSDELAAQLAEAIRGESVDGHPLRLRRTTSAAETSDCHILFADRGHESELPAVFQRPEQRGLLTVSDVEGSARLGVMIELARQDNRIRLRVNLQAARAAGLAISPNLLRPAEIVGAQP